MHAKRHIRVLVVDDDPPICDTLASQFQARDKNGHGEFSFSVDAAPNLKVGVEKVRKARRQGKPFRVLVLDLNFQQRGRKAEGMEMAVAFARAERLGREVPIQIVFTNEATLTLCVRAMRCGAWDFINKAPDAHGTGFQRVVDSAITRLRVEDLEQRLERDIAVTWLPQNISELQAKYGGKVVAIWHEPQIRVIASGVDTFELEDHLEDFRRKHDAWMSPFIVEIPQPSRVARMQRGS